MPRPEREVPWLEQRNEVYSWRLMKSLTTHALAIFQNPYFWDKRFQ